VRGQKPKNATNCLNFLFNLSNHIPHNHYLCHYVFFPIVKQVFMFCMLWSYRHVILFFIVIISYNLVFAPSNMLIKVVKFRNQKFFSPFNLCANMTPTHVHFLIGTNHKFCPWKLCCPNILKILISLSLGNGSRLKTWLATQRSWVPSSTSTSTWTWFNHMLCKQQQYQVDLLKEYQQH
jgi:hypothetical protein